MPLIVFIVALPISVICVAAFAAAFASIAISELHWTSMVCFVEVVFESDSCIAHARFADKYFDVSREKHILHSNKRLKY